MYLDNCLPDTHEIARKRGRTIESTFISADPVRRFSNLWNLEIFSLTVKAAFDWHESEERLRNKGIAGKKQELENLNTMLAKVLFPLLLLLKLLILMIHFRKRLEDFISEAAGQKVQRLPFPALDIYSSRSSYYPAGRSFSLAWLLAITKSFLRRKFLKGRK